MPPLAHETVGTVARFRARTTFSPFVAICIALLMSSGMSALAAQQQVPQPESARTMPLELAFARTSAANDRPSVSRDGRWVAFTVLIPPKAGITEARWLQNGAPSVSVGLHIRLTNVANNEVRNLDPRDTLNCWRPSFSPNSKKIAFYCNAAKGVRLWLYDVDKHEQHQVTDAPIKAKLWKGDAPIWSASGAEVFVPLDPTPRAAAGAAGRTARTETPTVTVAKAGAELNGEPALSTDVQRQRIAENNANLVAINVATGAIRSIVPASADPAPSIIHLSPTNKWAAYLSVSGLDCAVVSITGNSEPRLVASNLLRESGGDFWLNSCVWHPTEDRLFWVKDRRLWMLDLSTPAQEPVELSTSLPEVTIQPIAFSADGRSVFVGTEPARIDDFRDPVPHAIAAIPIGGGPPHMFSLPTGLTVQEILTWQGTAVWQWSSAPSEITVLCQEATTAERVVARLNLDTGAWATVWRGFANLKFAGSAATSGKLVAWYEDIATPPDLYYFPTDNLPQSRLTTIEPRLERIRVGAVERFQTRVPQPSGSLATAITTVLLPPGARRGDRLPGIVFQYPGLNLSYNQAANFGGGSPSGLPISLFTTRGYVVLLVDAPIGPLDVPGNPAGEMAGVVVPQVYHAADLGYVDIGRVAVIGQSAGGYTNAAIIANTSLFKAAVAISGFYDLAGWYEPYTIIHRRMGPSPWPDPQRYLTNSPYYKASDIKTPLLLLHGEADDACPVGEARKLFLALKTAGRTVQLATYAGEGHVPFSWALPNAIDATQRVLTFLEKYLVDPTNNDPSH